MSVIIGNNMCITYSEMEVRCPICTFDFDASDKMSKAKYPIFKTKCPACKGLIGISIPIFGGNTKCFEWNPPKTIANNQLENITPNKVNGKIVIKKPYDGNSDDELSDIFA
jgi:hypothetical protein